jgi:ubiquinone/menaquinone biosynthesis C-methylase UbiE
MATTQPTSLETIRQRQQQTWADGDYGVVAATIPLIAERLCEAADLRAGQRVLDVATGTGNTAIAAARRWCDVTGVDYVVELLDRARERAAAERLDVEFLYGDAEDLPFPDASFDAVLSTVGVMFAPNQQKAADELVRVCRPGGRIALANWTRDGFVGNQFRLTSRFVPPPPSLEPPTLWGSEEHVRELFRDRVTSLVSTRREFVFRYRSASHWLSTFRTFYGPTKRAFEALDEERQQEYERELRDLLARFNCSGDGSLVVPGEYLEIVGTKR